MFSLRWKANRIIVYWLVVGAVYGIATVLLGWGYALGVLAGMVATPLYSWKNRGR